MDNANVGFSDCVAHSSLLARVITVSKHLTDLFHFVLIVPVAMPQLGVKLQVAHVDPEEAFEPGPVVEVDTASRSL